MAYVPNPDDATQPTDAVVAETAQAEFRALKGKVNTIQSATGSKVTVRNTVLWGPLLSGLPSDIILSGTALGIDLKGAATAIYLAFAAGFSTAGQNDIVQAIATDQLNYWGALPELNTSFLSLDFVSPTALPTPLLTPAPPQYGNTYSSANASLLNFANGTGATIFLDDFGNVWAQQGAAQVQNIVSKFGTTALGGSGTASELNGTSDYISSAAFAPKLWNAGWRIAGWVYMPVLPAVSAQFDIASFMNAGGFGIELFCKNNAGTINFGYNLSGAGVANDIASGVVGTVVPSPATWYFVELTYDFLAGVYRLYVNGAQDQSTASTAQICVTSLASVGASALGAHFFAGYIDKFEMGNYCKHPGAVTYTTPIAAPSIDAQGYASNFYSLFDQLMYQITAPSTVAGVNPVLTAVNRIFLGEADTSSVVVTACRPYAYQGRYISGWAALPAAGTPTSVNHNIGTGDLKDKRVQIRCLQTELGYSVGDIVDSLFTDSSGSFAPIVVWNTRSLIGFTPGSTANIQVQSKADGTLHTVTAANWQYRLLANRGF